MIPETWIVTGTASPDRRGNAFKTYAFSIRSATAFSWVPGWAMPRAKSTLAARKEHNENALYR
jgi:hypothetical protein